VHSGQVVCRVRARVRESPVYAGIVWGGRTITAGVGAATLGGMLGSLEYVGTTSVVEEGADSIGRSESVMVPIVPPIGNNCV
jgi:hypothetical protein